MNRLVRCISILSFALILAGCESNNSFRTEAGVKSDLQGSWQWVPIPRKQAPQVWNFDSGNLTVTTYDLNNSSTVTNVEHSTYTVKTTLTTPYLFIESSVYNGKWIIINLDKKVLTMDKTAAGTNSLIQKEFVKI